MLQWPCMVFPQHGGMGETMAPNPCPMSQYPKNKYIRGFYKQDSGGALLCLAPPPCPATCLTSIGLGEGAIAQRCASAIGERYRIGVRSGNRHTTKGGTF